MLPTGSSALEFLKQWLGKTTRPNEILLTQIKTVVSDCE